MSSQRWRCRIMLSLLAKNQNMISAGIYRAFRSVLSRFRPCSVRWPDKGVKVCKHLWLFWLILNLWSNTLFSYARFFSFPHVCMHWLWFIGTVRVITSQTISFHVWTLLGCQHVKPCKPIYYRSPRTLEPQVACFFVFFVSQWNKIRKLQWTVLLFSVVCFTNYYI